MARIYAQLCTLVFFLVGIGGLFLGSATHVVAGVAQGNFGNLTLHVTYVRDALDIVLLAIFAYAGFFASRSAGRLIVIASGIVLFGLGVFGFIHGDNPAASMSIAGMNFPTIVNVFDTLFGLVAILAGLGTLSDEDVAAHDNRSFLREG